VTAHQAAEFYGEKFDDLHADLREAIADGDIKSAQEARKALLRCRAVAASKGVDVEYDGGWMVPDRASIRAACERMMS
jgi:hypothetical protein